jgi:ketosteroid isomerase-like protein
MSEPGPDVLRRLLDLEAIRDLARRYAHCIWQRDADGAAALFVEGGAMDTGDRPPLVGRDAIRDAYRAILPGSDLQPFVHDHLIELHGDRATGTCHLDLRMTRDGRRHLGAGSYEDLYVRAGNGWKFASRRLTMHFLVPYLEGPAEGGATTSD